MDLEKPPRSASGGGSYEICPCCSFEFGYHDDAQGFSYEEWRRLWIAEGMPWSWPSHGSPPDWDPVEQLRRAGFWPATSEPVSGDAEDPDWARKLAKFRKLFDRINERRRGVHRLS
jgi:hypothetical protein